MLDGVTTNPSLIAKSGRDFFDVVAEICALVDGPVSAEVAARESEVMIAEGRALAKIADNVAVKVPLTWDGLKACRALSNDGRQVNVTLCFSANQALLAAKAGAAFISPFVGRLDDIGHDGMGLIAQIMEIYCNYDSITTEVLVASVRSPGHVLEAARLGIAGVTILFDGTLMRGNRALKVSTRDFAAFETPHAAPLARTGMAMPAVSDAPADRARPIDAGLIRAQLDAIRAALDDHPVVELPCVPIQPAGLMAGMIDDLVARGVRGIVLAGFGAGNVPSDRGLTGQAIRRAGAAGVLVVIASRPIRGAVGDFDYAAGAWIAGTGAVPGGDATPVALVAKATILSAAAGHHGWDAAVVRALMARGLAGERG